MAASFKPVEDQIVVITGASSGIGLATALTFAARGARVVLVARSDDALAEGVRQITSAGGQAIHVVADVGRREDMQRVADAALLRFGRIDTWVNDAAVAIYGRLEEVTEADHRQLFETNFWGVVNGSLVALPYLRQSRGVLINVGSEVSEAAVPLLGMYTASKHAVKGFTDALRVEVEKVEGADVAITLIQPTAVDTPFADNARNYMDRAAKVPDPQIDPQKVADAIVHASTHHERDVKVGAGAVFNTTVAKIAPTLGDAISAKQVENLQRDEPPRDPAGALYTPSESPRITGSVDR